MKFIILLVLSFLLLESISFINYSHADSGFDTGYSSGGYAGGSYSSSRRYDVDIGGSGNDTIISTFAMVVLAIIVIIGFIVKSIEKHEINKEVAKQQSKTKELEGLSDEAIQAIDDNFTLSILEAIAKSAYEKYAKNISHHGKLRSIFTDEMADKFDFDANKKRKIEDIEFVDLRIIDFKKEKNIEFKAYYIVKCNDYIDGDKEKIVYNKVIFTIINIGDLWLIKDIDD